MQEKTGSLDFLFVLVGSAGDVLPGLTIARHLVKRGHRASVLTNEYFREKVESAGVEFLPNGSAEEYFRLTRHPDLWKPLKGTKLLLSDPQFSQMQGNQFETVKEWISQRNPGSFAVIASSLALGTRLVRDVVKFPLASLHLSPAVFRSIQEPPRLATWGLNNWLHHKYPKAFRNLVDRFLIDPLLESQLGPLRRKLGLPRISGWFSHWLHSPDLVIALFPEWFSSPGDLPPMTRQYPFLLSGSEDSLSPELVNYLANGSAPIVVTLGSAMAQATKAFETVGQIAKNLNRRIVFLTQHPEQLGPIAKKGMVAKWAPLGPLFQKASLVIHHGGIGTTAQAFAAGVPQLILPFAHDQPDNADRIKRNQWGDFHDPHWMKPRFLQKQMAELLESQVIREKCQARAQSMASGGAESMIGSDLIDLIGGSFRQKGSRS